MPSKIGHLGILAHPVGIHALWVITKLGGNHPGFPGMKDRPLTNSNVIDAINDKWEKKPFLAGLISTKKNLITIHC